jgi:hypothetical protein
MTPEEKARTTAIGITVARIGFDLATGNRSDASAAAKELMGMAVDLVPVEDLKDFLTEHDRVFADLTADVLEQIKLEGKTP